MQQQESAVAQESCSTKREGSDPGNCCGRESPHARAAEYGEYAGKRFAHDDVGQVAAASWPAIRGWRSDGAGDTPKVMKRFPVSSGGRTFWSSPARERGDCATPRITHFCGSTARPRKPRSLLQHLPFRHHGGVAVRRHHPAPRAVNDLCVQLDGQEFVALNGGPHFKFTEAVCSS